MFTLDGNSVIDERYSKYCIIRSEGLEHFILKENTITYEFSNNILTLNIKKNNPSWKWDYETELLCGWIYIVNNDFIRYGKVQNCNILIEKNLFKNYFPNPTRLGVLKYDTINLSFSKR